jgi:molybdenum-dependent DNA-binding transcriptional regulator ModE
MTVRTVTHFFERAACTASVWLVLYAIAVVGSLLLGFGQQSTRRRSLLAYLRIPEHPAMTFEQIDYFLTLAEEGSFVRAARRCEISQPSLTKAIKSLEAELGAPLFKRTIAGSRLTAFGEQIYPSLARLHEDRRQALELARTIVSSVRQMQSESTQLDLTANT